MPRCDSDGLFFRVFFITLFALALTFTVILTNVFIDIDGILSGEEKDKDSNEKTSEATTQSFESSDTPFHTDVTNNLNKIASKQWEKDIQANQEKIISDFNIDDDTKAETTGDFIEKGDEAEEIIANVLKTPEQNKKVEDSKEDYVENKPEDTDDVSFRSKRSIDPTDLGLQIRDPKVKAVITNRLATLLAELEDEEPVKVEAKTEKSKDEDLSKALDNTFKMDEVAQKKIQEKSDDILHMAMHNLMLQGIIKHMEFKEVYERMQKLMQSFKGDFKQPIENDAVKIDNFFEKFLAAGAWKTNSAPKEQSASTADKQKNVSLESKFINELANCEELQNEIKETQQPSTRRSGSGDLKPMDLSGTNKSEKNPPHNMMIKTVIDIMSSKKDNKTYKNENIKGLIKLIYNGKAIKFTKFDSKLDNNTANENDEEKSKVQKQEQNIVLEENTSNVLDKYVGKALDVYLKKYPDLESKIKGKRQKRHIRNKAKNKIKDKIKSKKKGDDLYVEIEAQIDGKSLKGSKKKKLIQNLIDKIQQAVSSDVRFAKGIKKTKITINPKKSKQKQDKGAKIFKTKFSVPYGNAVDDAVSFRDSSPISEKILKETEPPPKAKDIIEETWKKDDKGSGFLTKDKSTISDEIVHDDVDYVKEYVKEHKSTDGNGISQRIQQPLTSDSILLETENLGEYNDVGDLKFYVKDMDGTGFSIGFNQYVGEAPDPETIQLFTGLQKLIKTYHQNYDLPNNGLQKNDSIERRKRETKATEKVATEDFIAPAPVTHSNEYEAIFDRQYLPYDSYSQIFEDQSKRVSLNIHRENNDGKQKSNTLSLPLRKEQIPLVIDDNIFKKRLKPSEILGIANLLDRKKRSPLRLSTFLNTNKKNKHVVHRRFPRTKRQIDNIRILAADTLSPRRSDENMFVVSDENVFADRAALGEEFNDKQEEEEEEENEYPSYDRTPHYGLSQINQYNIFGARARHNALMSKYPHLFLEELSRSKEEDSNVFYSKLMGNYPDIGKYEVSTPSFLATPVALPIHKRTMSIDTGESFRSEGASIPATGLETNNPNYKLTVKIVPKVNSSDPFNAGFKEVHTSINRSISRHGVIYSSQVNITEVSRVENANNGTDLPLLNIHNSVPVAPVAPQVPSSTGISTTQIPMNVNEVTSDYFEENSKQTPSSTTFMPIVEHIKEQQQKMQKLLSEHKKKIDQQLSNLKIEKQNIEEIFPVSSRKSEVLDIVLPTNPPKHLLLNKAEAGELISSALMKLHDTPHLNAMNGNGNNSFALADLKHLVTSPGRSGTMSPTVPEASNQPSASQPVDNLPSASQPPMSQQSDDQQFLNQHSGNQQSINQQPFNQPPVNQSPITQQLVHQAPSNQQNGNQQNGNQQNVNQQNVNQQNGNQQNVNQQNGNQQNGNQQHGSQQNNNQQNVNQQNNNQQNVNQPPANQPEVNHPPPNLPPSNQLPPNHQQTPPTASHTDPEKIKILQTIQRNENLTNVILFKIDKNTNLLQHFLTKLTERLEQNTVTRKPIDLMYNDNTRRRWSSSTYNHAPYFRHTSLDNLRKNENHTNTPYNFAYQQPYLVPNKPIAPITNTYQGPLPIIRNNPSSYTSPIHNSYNFRNPDVGKPFLPDMNRDLNRTRFYLHDKHNIGNPGFMRTYDFKHNLGNHQSMAKAYDILRIKNAKNRNSIK